MLLRHGYSDLGVQTLLAEVDIPKGSFYHHFADKEDFALQVIDHYMAGAHTALDAALGDKALAPLARVRRFFTLIQQSYRQQGYMGCLLGGLGQELSGISKVFRRKIEQCLAALAARLGACLAEAQASGEVREDLDPQRLGNLLVDCWEGAALRSRLRGDAEPLTAMLDFCLTAAVSR